MTMPTDPISLIILGIDLALEGQDILAGYARLSNGISAKAHAEGRDVTPDEMAIIKGLEAAAVKRRQGK